MPLFCCKIQDRVAKTRRKETRVNREALTFYQFRMRVKELEDEKFRKICEESIEHPLL
jgi:hypothetical protein